MKITVNNVLGAVVIELLSGRRVVHRERFEGKTTTPYTRSIRQTIAFDSHRAVTNLNRDDLFTYGVEA
ncbi:hypothetical protein [Pseudomonas abietaniphila]|uniref:Uncharacterized protein n=1 Tax=Pseudomonas abietaniphila TaxID=89065 RepID=A0A1G8KAA8_9PSED|nr:hypothetical protein [Pseudomonas abietaniphila]SDI40307.1 hypothetical protein SAMN05216605_11326 [Pseudomonas abietaniphila]